LDEELHQSRGSSSGKLGEVAAIRRASIQVMIDAGTEELDRCTGEALTLDHLVVRVFRAICAKAPSAIMAIDVSEYRERGGK